MSCFSIKRLVPARKAWRVFTKNLQFNLHKLRKSKAIKKPKRNHLKATTKRAFLPTYRQFVGGGSGRVCKVYRLKKQTPPPVYIDQLFVHSGESSSSVESISNQQKVTIVADKQVSAVSVVSREEDVSERNKDTTADDMWESLVLASPQMHGIDKRAEEFIARFRAEMQRSACHL